MWIGTWNLAGRWSPGHRRLLEDAGCDVWLLTELPAAFKAGRAAIQDLAAAAGLRVVTAEQPHAIDGLLSIDHIAVPAGARVASCRRIAAVADARRLSDHDAYVVELGSR